MPENKLVLKVMNMFVWLKAQYFKCDDFAYWLVGKLETLIGTMNLIKLYVTQYNDVSLKTWRNGLTFVLRILASVL